MKGKIKKIIKKLIFKLPKKYILFESAPAYTDNTWSAYEFIKENKFCKNHKLVWVVKDKKSKKNNIPTIINDKGIVNKVKYFWYNIRAKVIVFSNDPQWKSDKTGTKSICLCHGSKSKNTRGKYELPQDLDYILIQADMFKNAAKHGYNLSNDTQMVTLGYPRNDDLLKENNIDRNKLFGKDFSKMIVWYPTFRQHKNGRYKSSVTLPVIDNKDSAIKINNYAKENDVLIVLKPHFAQDTSYIKDSELSNLIIIDDNFLKEHSIRSYQLLGLSDALLTDYSSVYYDYLLLDKPIGLVWEDYEEYKKGQGFALDPDIIYQGGEKIYNDSDFIEFISHIVEGKDVLNEERNKIKDMSNVHQDDKSSLRVANFILDLANE